MPDAPMTRSEAVIILVTALVVAGLIALTICLLDPEAKRINPGYDDVKEGR